MLSKQIPFFEWSKWIDEKFEKEWFDFMYRKNKRLIQNVTSKIPGAVRVTECLYIFTFRMSKRARDFAKLKSPWIVTSEMNIY